MFKPRYKPGDVLEVLTPNLSYGQIIEVKFSLVKRCPGDILPKIYYHGKTILLKKDEKSEKFRPVKDSNSFSCNISQKLLLPLNSKRIDLTNFFEE